MTRPHPRSRLALESRTSVLANTLKGGDDVRDLRDLIAYHQLCLHAEGRTPATRRQYLFFHGIFLKFLQGRGLGVGLDQLNPVTLRQSMLWYQGQQHRNRSRGGEVATRALVDMVKRLGSFGEDEGIFESNPVRRVKRVRIAHYARQPFTRQEIAALWGASTQTTHPLRDQAYMLILLDTGMRVGEAASLKRGNVRLEGDDRSVTVGASGKGRRDRTIPIGDRTKRDGGRTVRALRRYLDSASPTSRSGDAVFLARDGYGLTSKGGNHLIHRLGNLAGVENCHPHRFRHTYCTWYLTTYPGDEIGLRRIVGHLSREVLEAYVHLAQSTIADRAGRAAPSTMLLSG